jgi:hypothetical protein
MRHRGAQATHMATHARTLIAANGLADKIEVFQCAAEELQLPEKVDIIISEWMGCAAPRTWPGGCARLACLRPARFDAAR